ncbi:unnamed protein product [Musa textilis]
MALHGFQESFLVFRPLFFNGSNYTYWKTRMRVFLISLDFNLWNIVENGFQLPFKPTNEWSDLEKRSFSLNAKAMNALFCALDKNEFNRISTCKTVFEIWRTLEITHEGTSRVKDSKVNILMHDFEVFRMAPSETIDDMFSCFSNVINSLKALGKCFSDFELISKILKSLPKRWDPKVTTIQEAKDLNNLSIEELIGSLMTYEMSLLEHFELDEHLNHLPKNRKDLELRTMKCHLSDDSSDEDNENFELQTLNFNKFIKQKSKIDNELKRRKRPKKKKACKEESSKEEAKWALTVFDNEVRNSPKLLLPYFEIT